MNFKPTLWKSIISIILVIVSLIGFYLNSIKKSSGMVYLGGCGGNAFGCFVDAFVTSVWFYWLISLIIVYIIWSLFQKR